MPQHLFEPGIHAVDRAGALVLPLTVAHLCQRARVRVCVCARARVCVCARVFLQTSERAFACVHEHVCECRLSPTAFSE